MQMYFRTKPFLNIVMDKTSKASPVSDSENHHISLRKTTTFFYGFISKNLNIQKTTRLVCARGKWMMGLKGARDSTGEGRTEHLASK